MVRTYDPKLYSLVIGGVPVSGYADGTFFKATRHSDNFTKNVGTGGEVARAHQHDRSGDFTFTLQRTSLYNDVLSTLTKSDEEANTGVVPILVKDNVGATVCGASAAWVKKWPDEELGKDVNNREWVFEVENFETFKGGSTI